MRRRAPLATAAALVLLALAPATGQAQSAVQAGATPGPELRLFPFLGLRAGTPQRASFSLGAGIHLNPQADPDQSEHEVLLVLAPGLGAERASLSYVDSPGRFGSGIAGGLTALRTTAHPWQAPENATYVGVDLSVLPFIAIGPRLGILRRVSRPTDDRSWLWTLDFGFGF